MSPDSNPAIRELLETRLDALHEGQEQIRAEQQQIRSEMNSGLATLGGKVDTTNGRVTGIELREAMAKAALEEHRRMEAIADRRNEKWIGIFPTVIASVTSALVVIGFTLLLTGTV